MSSSIFYIILFSTFLTACCAPPPNNCRERDVMISNRMAPSDDKSDKVWKKIARDRIRRLKKAELNTNVADNVIFFLGDGMSVATQTAARIYLGQLAGLKGEESELSFDRFPVSGLSKTYCVDSQVPDSACTATAYLGGVKANYGTIGVTAEVPHSSCRDMQNSSYHVHSIAKLFKDDGRSIGGRIDHAHHSNRAQIALDETVELSKAVSKALSLTCPDKTLILVTADHSHTMSMSGYPSRGNPILGLNDRDVAADNLKYLSLNYANGPGYRKEVNGSRSNVASENIFDLKFQYPAMVPLASETHGGEDVGVFALGPYQHFFAGVYEQSIIPHIIAHAAGLGEKFSS